MPEQQPNPQIPQQPPQVAVNQPSTASVAAPQLTVPVAPVAFVAPAVPVAPVAAPQAPQAPQQFTAPVVPAAGTQPVTSGEAVPTAEKKSLHNLLNAIKLNNIVLAGEIGLGDALHRLSVAISRSGVRFDENGNPTQKQVNNDLGKLLQETLNRIPRMVDYHPCSIGYDPTRPYFYEGEAQSIPINAEMVMLLPLGKRMAIFTDTDLDDQPTGVRGGV